MKPQAVASCRIALLSVLIAVSFTVAWAEETTLPREKLASIFPNAKNFVEKKADLTPEKVASIEEEIGAKLRPEDLKPTFYIAVNENKKPNWVSAVCSCQRTERCHQRWRRTRYDGKGAQS